MSEKAGCFRVSENFDTKALAERASREMSAMGYDVKLEKTEKGYRAHRHFSRLMAEFRRRN